MAEPTRGTRRQWRAIAQDNIARDVGDRPWLSSAQALDLLDLLDAAEHRAGRTAWERNYDEVLAFDLAEGWPVAEESVVHAADRWTACDIPFMARAIDLRRYQRHEEADIREAVRALRVAATRVASLLSRRAWGG